MFSAEKRNHSLRLRREDSYEGATLRNWAVFTGRQKGIEGRKKKTHTRISKATTESHLVPQHDKCHKQSLLSYMDFMFKSSQQCHIMPQNSLAFACTLLHDLCTFLLRTECYWCWSITVKTAYRICHTAVKAACGSESGFTRKRDQLSACFFISIISAHHKKSK